MIQHLYIVSIKDSQSFHMLYEVAGSWCEVIEVGSDQVAT